MEKYWKEEDFNERRQKELFKAMERTDPDAATIYHCLLVILNTFEHPEKLPIAGYCLRELINKLSLSPPKGMLSSEVNNLEDEWKRLNQKVELREKPNEKLKGILAGGMVRFVKKCGTFFDWKAEVIPKRKKQVETSLYGSSLGKIPPPKEVREHSVNAMTGVWDDANTIAHHGGKNTTVKEFEEMVESCERFIFAKLGRTFSVQEEIDKLISEVESNGK